jgi:predicted transcriptional regulator of viral defense system
VVFSIGDAQKITSKSYPATQQALLRLVRAGWLVKLGAGKFALVAPAAGKDAFPEANRFIIARELVGNAPYYISHESALEIHDMITRPIGRVVITTPRRLRSRKVMTIPYCFIYSKPENMWGYSTEWVSSGEKVQVSEVERTILDGLARPDLCAGVSEIITGVLTRKGSINWETLSGYAQKMGSQVVAKRLGYILEYYHLDNSDVIDRLQAMIGASYTRLDPILPASGRYQRRWRVQVNIDDETLKGLTTT